MSYFYHQSINHSKLFATGKSYINDIDNFWNQAMRHLRKFNSITKANLYYFKGCAWHFNNTTPQAHLLKLKHMG